MECIRNADNEYISAMPRDVEKLFSYKARILRELKRDEDEHGNDVYRNSMLVRYSICTVPVLPIMIGDVREEDREDLEWRAQACDHMLPVKMVESNIGSHLHLQEQLKAFYDEWLRPAINRRRYFSLHCDCAVFWPIMKVW